MPLGNKGLEPLRLETGTVLGTVVPVDQASGDGAGEVTVGDGAGGDLNPKLPKLGDIQESPRRGSGGGCGMPDGEPDQRR